MRCRAANERGQLGEGTPIDSRVPGDRALDGWGHNGFGQRGIGAAWSTTFVTTARP
jgi:hypothetical protein